MDNPPALAFERVSYRYPNATSPALSDVSFEVPTGQVVLICGPSGGGKSTLMRCCLGLIPRFYGGDFSGEVFVHGQSIRGREPKELAPELGLVFQNPEDQVVASTVLDDVAFGPENLGLPRAQLEASVRDGLRLADIQPLAHAATRELSAGQLQKVALAGILALGPRILCLDEPTSQVDPGAAREIIELAAGLARHAGKTVLLAEHRLEFAAPLADRLLVVAGGRIMADGPPREILARPEAPDWGLNRPRLFSLALRLREAGRWLGPLPLTPAEFRKSFAQVASR
ncbi:MAG: ABC transporter ATP-binding protein [Chloroflexota bacterium]|nr:ABC transporter ATP-binding protein [Chloroflexota bacterium]